MLVDAQQQESYIGCYQDFISIRDLSGYSVNDGIGMTIEMCQYVCVVEGKFSTIDNLQH